MLKNGNIPKIAAMTLQSIENKLGEIKYRSLIAKQQTGKEILVKNEPTQKEFKNLLLPKLKETERTFKKLQKRNIKLSPYLEIGSEHCLRPMILENKFKAKGFATDISLFSLSSAPKFANIFNFKKVPKRICADAHNLPFRSNSFPFIFVYESFHHFPNPTPILKEIYRVLTPGGCLLVGGDPIKQNLNINLWKRPNKLRIWEKVLKTILILPFISTVGKTESEYKIIETAFDTKTWQKALSIFERVEATIETYPFRFLENITKTNKKDWLKPTLKTSIILFSLGGGLRAVCFKKSKTTTNSQVKLICPNCKKALNREAKLKDGLACSNCKVFYPSIKNVHLLLEPNLLKKVLEL